MHDFIEQTVVFVVCLVELLQVLIGQSDIEADVNSGHKRSLIYVGVGLVVELKRELSSLPHSPSTHTFIHNRH